MNTTKSINNILKEAWNDAKKRITNPIYDTSTHPMCTRTHYHRLASMCDRINAHIGKTD